MSNYIHNYSYSNNYGYKTLFYRKYSDRSDKAQEKKDLNEIRESINESFQENTNKSSSSNDKGNNIDDNISEALSSLVSSHQSNSNISMKTKEMASQSSLNTNSTSSQSSTFTADNRISSSINALTSPAVLKCILFDKDGRYRIMSTEAQKTELLLKHDLLPRDLRKIDKGYDDIVPLIVIREKSILLSILHIKALIKSDSVVLFNYHGTYSDDKLIENMSDKLKNNHQQQQDDKLNYEIKALETIFADVIDNLMIEMQIHVTVVNGILKELENDIDLAKLKYLLIVSKKLRQFLQKATLIRDLIDEMLDQDEDLAELYLTDKTNGLRRSNDDHQEIELILETYSLHCDAIVQTIESRVNDVRTTEEIINIILDSNRNDLMLLNLNLSITLMCMAGLLFVAAAYGMNLENFIEEKDNWFYIVILGSTLFGIFLFRNASKRLTKLQKVQLTNRS